MSAPSPVPWYRSPWTLFGASLSVFLAFDWATKAAVRATLDLGQEEVRIIPGFLSLIHAENPNAAFGMLSFLPVEARVPVLVGLSCLAVVVLAWMNRHVHPSDRVTPVVLGLISSGALGNNLIDRVTRHTVTDFIRVYTTWPPLQDRLLAWFQTTEWPTFNVADAAIVVGVILYLLHAAFQDDARHPAGDDPLAAGQG